MAVTSAAEGLSANAFIITEMQTIWLMSDAAEYHIEASVEGVPPITLGGIIENAGCDCPPFNADDCVDPGVGGLSCIGRDMNSHSYTEGGMRSANGVTLMTGNWYSTSTDFARYWKSGDSPSEYPDPGVTDDIGNGGGCQGIFSDGITDYFVGGAPFAIRVWLIGPGTLTIATAAHIGGLSGPCVPLATAVGATAFVSTLGGSVASGSAAPGSPVTVTIPDDDECAHYVDIFGDGAWGYAGANWTPLSTFEACTPDPGQPIVPEHFTGDGSTTTFTLAWPYMPGSLVVLVEGVDWSDQVTEDDPSIGDFSLAYPPPLATDPEPNVEVHYRYPK